MVPLLFTFFFLFPFFLLLVTAAGPARCGDPSFSISADARSEDGQGGDVASSAICAPLKPTLGHTLSC
jgi:hypothetical protein